MLGDRPSLLTLGGIALAGLTVASAAAALLWALATPANLERRLAAIGAKVDRMDVLARAAQRTSIFTPGAVCPSNDAAGAARIRDIFAAAASGANVTLTELTALPSDEPALRSRLAPMTLSIQGEGAPDAVYALLDHMAQGAPEVFVDRIDLVARQPNVSLRLVGRVFCWTRAGS